MLTHARLSIGYRYRSPLYPRPQLSPNLSGETDFSPYHLDQIPRFRVHSVSYDTAHVVLQLANSLRRGPFVSVSSLAGLDAMLTLERSSWCGDWPSSSRQYYY